MACLIWATRGSIGLIWRGLGSIVSWLRNRIGIMVLGLRKRLRITMMMVRRKLGMFRIIHGIRRLRSCSRNQSPKGKRRRRWLGPSWLKLHQLGKGIQSLSSLQKGQPPRPRIPSTPIRIKRTHTSQPSPAYSSTTAPDQGRSASSNNSKPYSACATKKAEAHRQRNPFAFRTAQITTITLSQFKMANQKKITQNKELKSASSNNNLNLNRPELKKPGPRQQHWH